MVNNRPVSWQYRKTVGLLLAALLLFTLSACDVVPNVIEAVRTTEATPVSKQITPTLTLTATIAATETEPPPTDTPQPTETPVPIAECVPHKAGVSLAEPDFEDFPEAILKFLNQGGGAIALEEALTQMGVAAAPVPVTQVDLNDDGGGEMVVSIIDPESSPLTPSGSLLIYLCLGDQFGLSYQEHTEDGAGAPTLVHARDLNADGATDLVTSSKSCGAHTCFEDIHILSWNGKGFENRMADSTAEIPFPDIQLTDYDLDHIYSLEVVGKGYGSVGAGPQRDFTTIWQYNPKRQTWQSGETTVSSSNYRIHVVHDADDAMKRGDIQVAQLLYDQAFNDPELLEWGEPVNEQLTIGGYARYKIVVAYALQGDLADAQQLLQDMGNFFPRGIPQRDYVELAQVFLDTFEESGQTAACRAAEDFAEAHSDTVLRPLGSEVYGYANRDYSAADMCP